MEVPDPLDEPVDAVVDLADLGLSSVELDGQPGDGSLRLGATTTLAALATVPPASNWPAACWPRPPSARPPSTSATQPPWLASCWAPSSASELLLALLALDAQVAIAGSQPTLVALDALLAALRPLPRRRAGD